MAAESILLVGDDRRWYHKLKSELRATPYRLLRARNERVAGWLTERVKIGCLVLVPEWPILDAEQPDAAGWEGRDAVLDSVASFGQMAPTLVIRRETLRETQGLQQDDANRQPTSAAGGAAVDPLALCAGQTIPVLHIVHGSGAYVERDFTEAIERGADYVLFAPYEQNELVQALRSVMLNGRAPRTESAAPPPLEIAMRDRMTSLPAGREQLARLLSGAVEQLVQARIRVGWCESEIRALRQAGVRREMEVQSRGEGLPEVVQGVAHDFANLLEAAGAAATGLHGQSLSPRMYRDAMRSVMEQSQELLETLTEITGPGRENWRTEPVELDGLVRRALESALLPLREPHIRVRVRMGGLEPVWGHRTLVHRAMVNLIWNAVQAMPYGGMLSVLGYVQGSRVVIEVGDTGVGIAAADQERILRGAFTTKPGHRGIGLTMVRELIEKCGGEITFSSQPNQGSLFSIALPVADRTALTRRAPSTAAEAARAGKLTLVPVNAPLAPAAAPPRASRAVQVPQSVSPVGSHAGPQKDSPVVLQP